jgi:hypothetical protein
MFNNTLISVEYSLLVTSLPKNSASHGHVMTLPF